METPTEPTASVEQLFRQPAAPTPPQESDATATTTPKKRRWWLRITVGLAGLLFILGGTVYVTEAGFIHTGLDKLYGKTNLAVLWGGLPADSTTSLKLLLANAGQVKLPDQFQVTDNSVADLSLDFSQVSSLFESTTPVTTPLTKDDASTFYAVVGTAASDIPSQITIPSDTTTAPALTTTESASTGKITAHTTLDISGLFNQATKQATLNAKLVGQTTIPNWKDLAAETNLVKNGNTLYIQVPDLSKWSLADAQKAAFKQYVGQYIKVELDQLKNDESTLLNNDQIDQLITTLAANTKRVAIERVNGHAASHWRVSFDKSSLLKALQEAGTTLENGTPADSAINQTTVQNTLAQIDSLNTFIPNFTATFDFWIRHGDYVPVKSQTTISLNSTVVTLNFGTDHTLINQKIAPTDIIIPPTKNTVEWSKFTEAFNGSTVITDDTAVRRDQQRVADLEVIANDLSSLKGISGRYPISESTVRLDDPTSPVAAALAGSGKAITTFKDPTADKYYYGYTSDGTTYKITAVIEDSTQTTCTTAGSICLYSRSPR